MNTNDLLLKEEVFKIVGCAFEVPNTMATGYTARGIFATLGICWP